MPKKQKSTAASREFPKPAVVLFLKTCENPWVSADIGKK